MSKKIPARDDTGLRQQWPVHGSSGTQRYLRRDRKRDCQRRGWMGDHVSVSLETRCPTWDEMCQVKALFFDGEDCVLQFHPPKSEYVNNHPYCLHLWRPHHGKIPMPPKYMV